MGRIVKAGHQDHAPSAGARAAAAALNPELAHRAEQRLALILTSPPCLVDLVTGQSFDVADDAPGAG